MNKLNLFQVFLVSVLIISCSNTEKEYPLYKMNGSPSEQVSVGGILGEYFYSNEMDTTSFSEEMLDEVEPNKFEKLTDLAELYANTGNAKLLETCETAWDSIRENVYDENERSENWIKFNATLLKLTADSKYGDEMEKAIYNSFLGNHQKYNSDFLSEEVAPVFYTRYLDQVYVNVFGNSSMEYHHTTGGSVRIIQDTKYPYDGFVKLKFETDDKRYVDLHIRIPEWAEKASVTVGGVKYKAVPGKYARVTKKWKTGDVVEVILPMRPFIKKEKGSDADSFRLQYGVLNMASSLCVNNQFARSESDPYQHLKFVSPPGEVPTFTYGGYQDTTIVIQPYFFINEADSCRTSKFPI